MLTINTPTLPLTIWFCRILFIARSGWKLNLDWQGAIPGFSASAGQPHWRLGSVGMAQARQVIGQLEHESSQHVSFANEMAELLFGQLVMLLNRHRYTSDSLPPTSSETLLDKLITRLAASLKKSLCAG